MSTKLSFSTAFALSLAATVASAQNAAPPVPVPAPMPPPSVSVPAAVNPPAIPVVNPPANAAVNPPVQGTNLPRDANGNAIPPQPAIPSQATGVLPAAAGALSTAGTLPTAPAITPFEMLDQAKAGAIKMDQVRGDAWLTQHFVECDANHNDEVTQSEYAKCTARR